jgi:DNA-binding LacI/PurR family transcriptional regulator/biotin operon repressor
MNSNGLWTHFESAMRFQSLPAQVADHLRDEIARGRWADYLPGERSLAVTLRVSRRTLTSALAQLQQSGVIESEPARGHRIVVGPVRAAPVEVRKIGLLTSAPLDRMRPGTTLWVNDLQALLGDAGLRLSFFHGSKHFAPQPNRSLAKLLAENQQECWLLAGSTEPMQRWFAAQKTPAVVVGTCHGDVVLPDVDLDFCAMGRHVAGRLAAFRHRKAALFQTIAPGYFTSETECERGFREVLKKTGVEPQVVYHERDRDSLVRLLKRMFSAGDHATALVVINSLDYLTTTSFLTQKGLRVPEDVSVIARNDDAFMTALLPEPTRYHASPHVLARRIFKLLMQVIDGRLSIPPHVRIMPEFIAGESLGLARAAAGSAQNHSGS